MEQIVLAATIAELKAGALIVPAEDPIGGAQVIRNDLENGTLTGASESRKDENALAIDPVCLTRNDGRRTACVIPFRPVPPNVKYRRVPGE
ncbi:hypothetical protein P6U16_21510 (plasmid) [Rhizobium sp. 32-5/1]|uniref:hypothetical protein n=1 Tax=Rhizobium sp. 32-5/1 TaxID=3019602 RepID=UPI00240CE936|nr:hypothetical protein [Rhizobium sp. 32-5/1]WEZ85664.1 hypothetical protein P6U16_21510 [Rhizobium sp. 32-5/1]